MNRKVYEESLDTSLVPLVNDVLFLIVTSCFLWSDCERETAAGRWRHIEVASGRVLT
jgi:hypothetical protein